MHPATQQACEIFIVEDDFAIRQALTLVLIEDGYRVCSAADGKDALDCLQNAPVLPRLILLDLMMPVMNGFDFRHRQRQDSRLCNIPVAVLSAIAQRLDPIQMMELDAVAVLGKPIDWSRLARIIHKHCPPNTP